MTPSRCPGASSYENEIFVGAVLHNSEDESLEAERSGLFPSGSRGLSREIPLAEESPAEGIVGKVVAIATIHKSIPPTIF